MFKRHKSEVQAPLPLSRMPTDIISHLLTFCTFVELCIVLRVSKLFSSCADRAFDAITTVEWSGSFELSRSLVKHARNLHTIKPNEVSAEIAEIAEITEITEIDEDSRFVFFRLTIALWGTPTRSKPKTWVTADIDEAWFMIHDSWSMICSFLGLLLQHQLCRGSYEYSSVGHSCWSGLLGKLLRPLARFSCAQVLETSRAKCLRNISSHQLSRARTHWKPPTRYTGFNVPWGQAPEAHKRVNVSYR